ncbi:MAG: hypothetical protein IPK04_12010 [Bdellovibrionales bacterium]|nr:hypothetical protein [Bdellovibrionales bacterium]
MKNSFIDRKKMSKSNRLLRIVKFCSFLGACVTSLDTQAMNPLRFTNRAQCAADSERPATSIFLILDSYNARKMIHNYAIATGQPKPESLTESAGREYRLAVTHNTLTVMQRLLQGRLPLLPTNLAGNDLQARRYRKIQSDCSSKLSCPLLHEYLGQLWQASEIKDLPARLSRLSQIDNFQASDFFPLGSKPLKPRSLACYLVKNFSPLQSHLAKTQASSQDVEEIAKAWMNKNQHITDCYDQSPEISNSSAILQIEISPTIPNWEKVGFDFWNSTKIISTWAWRKAEITEKMSPSYYRLFKDVALEESMMFIPNGCMSITPQKCDQTTLTENSIREFAKIAPTHKDHSLYSPLGPEQILLKQKPADVNDDILNLATEKSAEGWVQRFRKQFSAARGLSRNRIQHSLQVLHRLSTSVPSQLIKEGFEKLLQLSREKNKSAQYSLYYACQELRLSMDSRFNFYSESIKSTFESTGLSQLMHDKSRDPSTLFVYLRSVADTTLPIWDLAATERLTEPPSPSDSKEGFRPWAQEVLFSEKSAQRPDSGLIDSVLRTKPLALWNTALGVVANNTLCYDEADCLRAAVEAAISVNSAMKYASAFHNSKSINSGSLLNPYAELSACKIYDPWLKTKKAYEELFVGLVNTALFGWNNTPIYIDLHRTLPQVTSFKKLIEDGQIRFSPQVQASEVRATLFADLGPLVGVPCSLAITDQPKTPQINPYFFAGISLNYCDSMSEVVTRASNAQDIQSDPQKNKGFCVGCTLSLISAESTASFYSGSVIAPVKFGIHLFRTISNFVSAKSDVVNIPRQMTVDPVYASQVFRKFGSIPESCIQQIGKGLSCYSDACAARAADAFESTTGIEVQSALVMDQNPNLSNPNNLYVYLKTSKCQGEFRFPVTCRNKADEAKHFEIQLDEIWSYEKDCQKHIPELRNLL